MKAATTATGSIAIGAWRKALLAVCASLAGVALAYTASPPKTVTIDHSFGSAFHRMIGW
jgi:hypothetical protein